MTQLEINQLTQKIIGAAIEVQKHIGPGLLEKVYHRCLRREFELQSMVHSSEMNVPIFYKGENLDADLRCDFLVENKIIVELKAVDEVLPIHEAQILTYMNLLKVPKGIIINFNSTNIFYRGQKTYVNDIFANLPKS
jgi:GxxExxY protein